MRMTNEALLSARQRAEDLLSRTVSRIELSMAGAADEEPLEQAREGVLVLYSAWSRLWLSDALRQGALVPETAAFGAAALLRRVGDAAREPLTARNIGLSVQAGDGLAARGDAEAVEALLWLLLAARVAAGDRRIALDARAEGGQVRFSVRGEPGTETPAEAEAREALARQLAGVLDAPLGRVGDAVSFRLPQASESLLSAPAWEAVPGISRADLALAGL